MRVVIGSDAAGMPLKELVKETLIEDGHEVVDLSETPAADFVDSATAVAADLMENEASQGLCFDAYGVGSYMAATRVKGMVAANISDERSAYMTREHNNSRIVCLGGLCFDAYGVGSYMAATRVKGMVAANISDERSAYMTREHNNSRIVCLGSAVVGSEVAKKIAREFLKADYAAGRHQVRVDMLNKMA